MRKSRSRAPLASGASKPHEGRLAILLGLTIFLSYALSGPGRIDTIDGQIKFEVARSWILTGEPALTDPALKAFGAQGRRGIYPPYTFAASVASAPLVGLGLLLTDSRGELLRFFYPLTSSLFGAALCVLTFILMKALGLGLRTSVAWAFVLAFASYLWPLAASAFDQAQQAFFLALAVVCAWQARERESSALAVASGLSLGFLLNYQPNLAMLAPGAMLPLVFGRDGSFGGIGIAERGLLRRVVLCSAGVLAGGLALLGFNLWRFGQFIVTSPGPAWAGHPGLLGNPLAGLAGLLLSPGKSVFLYSPVVILGLLGWRELESRDRGLAWAIAAVSATQLAFFSCVSFFGGDWAWGPRYLEPVLALWIVPAAFWARGAAGWRRRTTALVVALGCVVQLLGISVDYHHFFYSRGFDKYFWHEKPWIYFEHSALLSRPGELASILGDGPPAEVEAFVPNPYRVLSTYAVFGPRESGAAPSWMRRFSIFWLPKPWPLWSSRLPPGVLAPVPETLAPLLLVGCLALALALKRELDRAPVT